MQEIEEISLNGYQAVSTFSGCGGSCLGLRMAGFNMLWANEFVPAAQEVYKLNHHHTYLDTRDIRQVNADDILRIIKKNKGDIDLLNGSPPCASFSTAGKREACWGKVKKYSDTQQRVDDLFFEFNRILEGMQPRVFVAENVSGLVKGVAKGYFKEILRTLKNSGYDVTARVLDASWLGVPQARQRLIFIGVRNDIGISPAFPKPLPYQYTVREAIPWIVKQRFSKGFDGEEYRDAGLGPSSTIGTAPSFGCNVNSGGGKVIARVIHDTKGQFSNGDVTDKPACTVDTNPRFFIETATGFNKHAPRHPDQPSEVITQRPVNIILEPKFIHPSGFNKGKTESINTPAATVMTGGIGGSGHKQTLLKTQTETRKMTIAELKRICAFPDDFKLTGSYAQQWERLGRAVPPVMMMHIGKTIQTDILDKIKEV